MILGREAIVSAAADRHALSSKNKRQEWALKRSCPGGVKVRFEATT
jgi:hypothetical protein